VSPPHLQAGPRRNRRPRRARSSHATRAIAKILHKSVKTIESYKSRIKAKLGLDSPTAMWQFVHGARMAEAAVR